MRPPIPSAYHSINNFDHQGVILLGFFLPEGSYAPALFLSKGKWTCAGSGQVDQLLCRLGIQLRGADAAVVEEALYLVDGDPFAEHLRRPPMTKIMRVNMRQPQFSNSIVDHAPHGIG